jgi:DNA-binding transcriptional MerR regulator
MMTLTQVSRHLDVPRRTLDHHANIGHLRTHQHVVGGRRYVLPQDLEAYVETHIKPVRPDVR